MKLLEEFGYRCSLSLLLPPVSPSSLSLFRLLPFSPHSVSGRATSEGPGERSTAPAETSGNSNYNSEWFPTHPMANVGCLGWGDPWVPVPGFPCAWFLSWMARNPLDPKPEGCWARNSRGLSSLIQCFRLPRVLSFVNWVNFLNPSQTCVIGSWMDAIYSAVSFNALPCAAVLSHAQALLLDTSETPHWWHEMHCLLLFSNMVLLRERRYPALFSSLKTLWNCRLNRHLVSMSWPNFSLGNHSRPRLGSYHSVFSHSLFRQKPRSTI